MKSVQSLLLACIVTLSLFDDVVAHAVAPSRRFVVSEFAVADTVTGLVWQRAASAESLTWAAAETYCSDASVAGKTDWRLPTLKELQTIVDPREGSGGFDPNAFPPIDLPFFWSSTPAADSPSHVWVVFEGTSQVFAKTESFRARCVR